MRTPFALSKNEKAQRYNHRPYGAWLARAHSIGTDDEAFCAAADPSPRYC
jgi:hypothetical protein